MSIYERIGGAAAVAIVIDQLYERVVADKNLRPYFDGVDIDGVKAHQRDFVAVAIGGPESYAGRHLDEAHTGLGINSAAFARLVDHLVYTLKSLGVDRETIAAIVATLAPLENEVVANPHRSEQPPIVDA